MSLEWKSEGVMDNESDGEFMRNVISLVHAGQGVMYPASLPKCQLELLEMRLASATQ